MRRRDILILFGVVLITPLAAAAQSRSDKIWRIAFFWLLPDESARESARRTKGEFCAGHAAAGPYERARLYHR
jgi:hypothetical protein